MNETLQWVSAVAAVIAAGGGLGIWASTLRTRWRLRLEQVRTDRARQENELHRRRFQEVWMWAHDQPDGPDRPRSWRWYAWWIGDPPGVTPGSHAGDADEAYNGYIAWLAACYHQRPRPQRDWPRLPSGEPRLAWLDKQRAGLETSEADLANAATNNDRGNAWTQTGSAASETKPEQARESFVGNGGHSDPPT